ncbi:MAG: N-acetylmuramoyl-L-alanine amidase [Kordiimonadaceae bacterium]|nr:N-acetylmuramoyl-L-alanine amidase [Kordiimonadaceae bacterium]
MADIRFGENGDATRFVLDVSGPVKPHIFLLANPSRVVIDMPEVQWQVGRNIKPRGLIAGFRHGLFSSGTYRIVLDLKKPAVVSKAFSLPASERYSDRYVIDLTSAGTAAFTNAVKISRAARLKAVKPITPIAPQKVVRRTDNKRIVVVDAGHGGVDPGTLGRFGANEKTLTLSISREIKRELEKTGRYKVYLTRNKDIYVPHRRRFALAKRMGADLFVSVHVDAIENSKVRGGTVYTLNERASDREAARLAAKENKSDVLAGVDLADTNDEVSSILIDLAQRETMNASAQFAEILLPEMRKQVRMHKKGHRFANLLVLKSPDVPSILLETGYQTNKADARMLNSRKGQKSISKALRIAADKYFETLVVQGR